MIKTLADEFMDIMNNLNEGCTDTRIKELYKGIKDCEDKIVKAQAIADELLSWQGHLCNSASIGHRLRKILGR